MPTKTTIIDKPGQPLAFTQEEVTLFAPWVPPPMLARLGDFTPYGRIIGYALVSGTPQYMVDDPSCTYPQVLDPSTLFPE